MKKIGKITSQQISWLREQNICQIQKKTFLVIESYGTSQKDDVSVLSLQEQIALETLEDTAQFSDNHDSVGWLRREIKLTLQYNKLLALSRFHSLEKKIKQQFTEKYKNTINNYTSKGYAVKL